VSRSVLLQRRNLWPLLAGAIYALTFSPEPIPSAWLAWTQLVTLALLVHWVFRAESVGQAALTSWLFGLTTFVIGLYWLTISMHVYGQMPLVLAWLALVLFAAYLALFGALSGALARWLGASDAKPSFGLIAGQSTIWAAAWTGGEWLRGVLFTGFPWLGTAYGQVDSWLAGWSILAGAYGTTFVTAWIAAALALNLAAQAGRAASAFTPKQGGALALAILLVFGGAFLEQASFTAPYGSSITTRLVQGNIDQGVKFDESNFTPAVMHHIELASHRAENRPAQAPSPTLIVLPETVMTRFPQQVPDSLWQAWVDLSEKQQATILLGTPLFDPRTREYTNSVIAIDPSTHWRSLANSEPKYRYDKQHLVPFGEFVPWGFRWFVDLMRIPLGDFNRGGSSQASFVVGQQRIAANICYEDVFGQELLPAIREGATILANFSNLGWFGDSWALRQHWQMARLRAIETQRPVIRATNTGITGAISETGQPIAALPTAIAGYLDVQIQGRTGLTPYTKWGNYPPLVLVCFILLVAFIRRVRTAHHSRHA